MLLSSRIRKRVVW